MKIGISGASGHLGAATVRFLKARVASTDIIGISRSPESLKPLGVEGRFGDFDKPDAMATAFAGLDRLLIIPSSDMAPGARARQHVAAVEAALTAGVTHVVFVSAMGARGGRAGGVQESYFAGEQALMRRAAEWTILRMAYYAESFADQVSQGLPGGVHASIAATPVNFVSRDDVAAAAAGILATSGHHGALYHATGPAALSGEQRAAAIAKVTGKPTVFAMVPRPQFRQALEARKLPALMVDAIAELQEMWASGDFDVTTGDVARLAGAPPCSLEDVLSVRLA
jgi:NAD(P)H dehydrogenase (quinone)